jgi:hypothetical protein
VCGRREKYLIRDVSWSKAEATHYFDWNFNPCVADHSKKKNVKVQQGSNSKNSKNSFYQSLGMPQK